MRLYKDIDAIQLQYLLEATPFSIFKEKNFSNRLSEKTFFDEIYVPGGKHPGLDPRQAAEIINFENGIRNAITEFGNEHARVSLIHIKGYGGCGKTTFVHFFLRELKRQYHYHTDFLDYEKAKNAEAPLIRKITDYFLDMKRDVEETYTFLYEVSRKKILNMDQFEDTCPMIKQLSDNIRNLWKDKKAAYYESRTELERCLSAIKQSYDEPNQFMLFLLVVWLLLRVHDDLCAKRNTYHPVITVIDNVDSMEPLSEEMRVIPALRKFTDCCSVFFVDNIGNENRYGGNIIGKVFEKSKFVYILTTRLVTARRYSVLGSYRGNENQHEWADFEIPENYYDHEEIVRKRVEFFKKLEEMNPNSQKIKSLEDVMTIASVVYRVPIFKKLFNGNIRYCFSMICYIAAHTDMLRLIQKCNNLEKREYARESGEGINGIVLNIILKRFKSTGIYDTKLHLTECCPDGKVSCSRLILTILREKDDSCSMYDLFEYLYPIFPLDDICKCVFDLSEEGREVWRRLLTFDKIFPSTVDNLIRQAEHFSRGEDERSQYSNIVMTTAGKTYIEQIVPHFEFMLSRHSKDITSMINVRNQPLFADDSLEMTRIDGERIYRFDKTIKTVFDDVKDCCHNAYVFGTKLVEEKKIVSFSEYLTTPYNYRAVDRAEVPGARQSYESRLIFRHISYIERYRMYLLKKNALKDKLVLVDVNKRLIGWISAYLGLYDSLDRSLQTERQDEAAIQLMDRISIIERQKYMDFTTRIEVG